MSRARFALAVCAALCLSAPAFADVQILSAPQVQDHVQTGKMILIDIRSRGEWQDSGLAQGAWPISMHERDFGPRMRAVLAKYTPDQIALICATGGRTARMADILEKNGILGVTDVSEGMFGNRNGPGWIKRGLPIVTLKQAQTEYDAAMQPK